jgi:acylglycerol lipase
MAAVFRFGFRETVPWSSDHLVEDVRWSLAAMDPRIGRLRCGSFAASDGAEIPYRLWLAKRPRASILLLHGACDYSGSFDEVAPSLARRGFTALAVDQRGFGATATRGSWSGQDRMAQDVADAARFLERRLRQRLPLFVLGESMGGAIAVMAASRKAIDLSGLILISPGAVASLFWSTIFTISVWLLRWMPRTRELVFDRLSGWDLSPGAAIRLMGDPLVLRAIRPDILSGLLELSCAVVQEAKRVTVPTLTLVAGKDDIISAGCIRQLHDNLAGPKVWEVIDGPHLLLQWQRGHEVLGRACKWMNKRVAETVPRQPKQSEGTHSAIRLQHPTESNSGRTQ